MPGCMFGLLFKFLGYVFCFFLISRFFWFFLKVRNFGVVVQGSIFGCCSWCFEPHHLWSGTPIVHQLKSLLSHFLLRQLPFQSFVPIRTFIREDNSLPASPRLESIFLIISVGWEA